MDEGEGSGSKALGVGGERFYGEGILSSDDVLVWRIDLDVLVNPPI